jgi:hypothetical protein
MKPLPEQFRHGGFDYRVLARDGDVVLMAKRNRGMARDIYEVCIVRRCPDRTIAGKPIPARECLPSPEHWGTYGWSPYGLERARELFRELAQSRQLPDGPAHSTASPFGASEAGAGLKGAVPAQSPV